MDLKQLEYFVAIAEEGKITLAAQRLNIAQPPLSMQLKKLEDELGVTLFDRTSRRLQITDAGQLFLSRARQILDLSFAAQKEMYDYANGYEGTVYLGITPTAVPLVLSDEIKPFHMEYKKIDFELLEGDTGYILDLVQKGIVDIGIVRSPIQLSDFCHLEKSSEDMVAVMLPDFNWSESSHCNLVEMDMKDIIIYRRYESLVMNHFALCQVLPHITVRCDRSSTAISCAESGLGIAILPAGAVSMAHKELICKTIDNVSLKTKTVAIWMENRHLSKPARAFLEYFRQL